MNILFVFYVPSGGVETLNRQRCKALRRYGIQADCLYYDWGSGMQNYVDFPVFITNDEAETRHILNARNYDAIIVTTDHKSFEWFRGLGYGGKLVLEIQGYGSKEFAKEQLTEALPLVNAHASGLINPNTPHITQLFQELYPNIPHFHFNNCFDSERFTYQANPKPEHPIIAWIGRIEDNKNWKEFLYISHLLSYYIPDLQLWMFEDNNLAIPHEREHFMQMIDQLNLRQRLSLRSNVPNGEMPSYFSIIGDSGGFLCSTSKVEGAPLSVLEAMSCKCPVLATDSDGVSASIVHNVTGKSYKQGDISQAAYEAIELMSNRGLREDIKNAAQLHLQTAFNSDLYCREFIDMLYSI